MTADERVWAAIRLEEPDRTPLIPSLLPEPAAGLLGISQARVANDNTAAVRAVFAVFDRYGGWDNPYPASYAPIQLQASGVFPMKMKIPGRDLADDIPYQLEEAPILEAADYEKIADQGFDRFFEDDYLWRISELTREERATELDRMLVGGGLFLAECVKRDRRPLFLANGLHPFFLLSLMRAMLPFTRDLYYEPEPLERALSRMTDDLIRSRIDFAKQTGIPLWLLTEERASTSFFPPRIFERFWWPYTKRIVEACWSEGIVTLFHLDSCWDDNLTRFLDLPRGSAVLEFDGGTDLFRAKALLRDHLCIKGDVPAALLSLATPNEVSLYCARLVSEVGRDGGFILASGCSVPPNARPENFQAMLDAARSHRP